MKKNNITNDINQFIKNLPTSIDRYVLWKYVNIKINRSINTDHVKSVTSLLIDELSENLINNKKIEVFNLGSIFLKKLKDKNHFDFLQGKITPCKGWRILKFKFSPSVHKYIINNLDIEETFKDKK